MRTYKHDTNRLLCVKQVAALLGVSVRSVHRLLSDNSLRRIKIRNMTRVDPDDLARLVEVGSRGPQARGA